MRINFIALQQAELANCLSKNLAQCLAAAGRINT